MEFKFNLTDEVLIVASRERGVVIGRAEYAYAERGYLLRYRDARGVAVEQWWTESALTKE